MKHILQHLVLIFFLTYAQGAVGLAIWVPSVTKQTKENESSDKRGLARGYTSLSPSERKDGASWRYDNGGIDLELSEVVSSSGHESNYEESILEDLKVLVSPFLKPCPLPASLSFQLVIYPNFYSWCSCLPGFSSNVKKLSEGFIVYVFERCT